jgi:hypothetical protein
MARVHPAAVLLSAALAVLGAAAQAPRSADPSAFFHPTVALSAAERARLDKGESLVRVVPVRGPEVAIFSAARIAVGGERLAAWVNRIAAFKHGPYVPAVARFSDPPRLEDLAALTLDDDDLEGLRRCRPGDCDLKLNDEEIARVRQAVTAAGAAWKDALPDVFRRLLLARAERYLAAGLTGIPPHHDQSAPVHLSAEFEGLFDRSPFLALRRPPLAAHLRDFPRAADPSIDSFLYWSKELLGGKPIIGINHVSVARQTPRDDLPEVIVVAKQIYATHYMTGSLAITTITGNETTGRYLMYLNRTRVDVLSGFFGGLVRRVMERRLRNEAGEVVQALRRRLESGPPPAAQK